MPEELYVKCDRIGIFENEIINAFENERVVDIREENGVRTNKLVYQLREDKNCKWLFIAHMKTEDESQNCILPHNRKIIVKGEYTPLVYDTLTGDIRKAEYKIVDGMTMIRLLV